MICIAFGGGHVARAQSSRGETIQQALTEPTRILLENVSLRDAIASITDQTGVDIHMAVDVMAFVPGGAGLIIQRVDIANIPLREGLTQLFAPLGMTWDALDDGVHIRPKDAVTCLGRAPAWEELDLLTELSGLDPSRGSASVESIRQKLQFRVPVREPWNLFEQALRDAGAGPADELLTAACEKLGWSWCLNGAGIVISPREHEIIRRLQRPISLRARREPLLDVIMAIGDALGISVRIEPGALATLPPAVRRGFTLELSNQTGERALEEIAAYTGLGYLVEPDGVYVFKSDQSDVARNVSRLNESDRRIADPYVAKIVVPLDNGTTLEWLVRYSELPPNLQERRADDLRRAFESLEKQ